ncbi:hypothetical protein MBOL_37980 [Mycobacteroides abscessus subsp. bolletii BD]|nr:hypothetical protein MBOL_37980 [Mycobacteroides abscessus subsp. bolletii BD]ORA30441.1 MCE family protein [Mycobacteroides abscessus subsp. bolletii]TPF68848.1 hypothetical protein XW60_08670 [Mycobacteroides abscessus subsp. bolletii]BBB43422.1 hypothetical protein MASB_39880 [Mycobacteroides abscessus subsp. bolletii BD]
MIRNAISIVALVTLLVVSVVLIGQQAPLLAAERNLQLVTLHVPDSGGLVPRSKVLLRGVSIGEVTTVDPDAQGVAVQFRYPTELRIPVDSEFRVENLSALGETYLSIKPAHEGAAYLTNGQHLIAKAGAVAGSIGEAAVAFTRLMGGLNPQLVHGIIEELNTALSDGAAVPAFATASRNFQTLVNTGKDDIRDLLVVSQRLVDRSAELAPTLAALKTTAPNFFDNLIGVVEGAIVFLYQTGHYPDDVKNGAVPLLSRVSQFVSDIGPDLYNLTEPLRPPLQATAAALMTFDTSRLLDSAIDSLETPGAFTVHVVQSR